MLVRIRSQEVGGKDVLSKQVAQDGRHYQSDNSRPIPWNPICIPPIDA